MFNYKIKFNNNNIFNNNNNKFSINKSKYSSNNIIIINLVNMSNYHKFNSSFEFINKKVGYLINSNSNKFSNKPNNYILT